MQRQHAMAEEPNTRQEEDYVIAFKSGNKLVAELLLRRIPQPAAITTTFKFSYYGVLALVSSSAPPSRVLGLEKCRYCASSCV